MRQKLVLFAVLSMALSACTPVSENSLLTDSVDNNDGYAVDTTPNVDELYLKNDSPTLQLTTNDTRADISGECFASGYPQHKIEAYKVSDNSKLTIKNIGMYSNPVDATAGLCNNGRFNLSINTSGWTAGSTTIRVRIYGIDSNGVVANNDSTGQSTFTLTRSTASQ